MKQNTRSPSGPRLVTHEGGPSPRLTVANQLRRSVLACLLWENTFYEDGVGIADRIKDLVSKSDPLDVARLAVEARERYKLRHVPLLLVRELARHPKLAEHHGVVTVTLERIIQRADELAEFLAIYWKEGKQPLAKQVKLGLARAFGKFSEYDLAKYNRDGKVKLRDALFMVHAKPPEGKGPLFQNLVTGALATPDTWEVGISKATKEEKPAEWKRLLREKKLGALALLRNLRNLRDAGVPDDDVRDAIREMKVDRVLPYRFIAAARYAPMMEVELQEKMFECAAGADKLTGRTALLVDVSGSMNSRLSSRSDLMRYDAAAGLAILLREIAERVSIYTFSNHLAVVPPRRGFALRDAIASSQAHGGTMMGAAIELASSQEEYDRMIVISDEQAQDRVDRPDVKHAYLINVAADQNGVGYGDWHRVTGFSEAVVDYVRAIEAEA